MAAGLGFKTFNTGDVLSAADVNGYLMQGILVFASATARDAAITSPEEGQFAFLKDTNVTTYYTGSAWANVDTTGMTNPMTTTGDVIYSSSGSTPARLGIGTAGQVLKVNSGATAPEWGAAPDTNGLVYLTGAAFSAVASVSLPNSTFTSTYTNYKLVFNITSAAGAAAETRFRMRASGSDDTAANYYMGGYQANYAGGNSAVNTNGGTYIPYGSIAAGSGGINSQSTQFEMTMFSPQASNQTVFTATGGRGSWTWTSLTGFYNASTAFDALTYYVDAGTITGNYRVYGIANS
jgi:hypothetical protein